MSDIPTARAAALTAAQGVTGLSAAVMLDGAGAADIYAAMHHDDAFACVVGPGEAPYPSVDPSITVHVYLYCVTTDRDGTDTDDKAAALAGALTGAGAAQAVIEKCVVMWDTLTTMKLRFHLLGYWA